MGKNSARRKRPTQKKSPLGLISLAVVVVVGALIGYSYWTNRPQSPSGATEAPSGSVPMPVGPVKTDAEQGAKGNVKGPDSAKVKLVEYADFQCPVCGTAHKIVEPQIASLISAGQVQYTYKHFIVVDGNVGGQESQVSAEATECAGDQGKFWAMHDFLFENQQGEGKGNFSVGRLKQFGANLGLDTTAFNTCIDTHKYRSKVQQQTAEAKNLRLDGTPSFLLNGKLINIQKFEDVFNAVNGAVTKQ